jgi:hypothetical protein
MSEQRERMKDIAERVAEALGVGLGPDHLFWSERRPGRDVDRVEIRPLKVTIRDGIEATTIESARNDDGEDETRIVVWLAPIYMEDFPVELFLRGTVDRFRVERSLPTATLYATESIRAKMQAIDNATEGLLSYGIERGGDEALREWWRDR